MTRCAFRAEHARAEQPEDDAHLRVEHRAGEAQADDEHLHRQHHRREVAQMRARTSWRLCRCSDAAVTIAPA